MRKRIWYLLGSLVLLTMLAACKSDAPAQTPRADTSVSDTPIGADDAVGDIDVPPVPPLWNCESLYAQALAQSLALDDCDATPIGGTGFEDCPGEDTANLCARRVFRDAETATHTTLVGASGMANFAGAYLPPCDDPSTGYDLTSECGAASPVRCTDGTRPIVYVDIADIDSKNWLFYLGGEGRSCVGLNGPAIDPWTCDKMYFGGESANGDAYDVVDARALSSRLPGGANPVLQRGTDSDKTILGDSPTNPFRNVNRMWFERCNAYAGDVEQILDANGTKVRVFQHGEKITRLTIDALMETFPERFDADSVLVLIGISDGSSALPFSGPRIAAHFKERVASVHGAGAAAVKVASDGLWFPMLAGEAAFNANGTDIGGYDGLTSDPDSFLDNYRDNPVSASIPGRTEVYSDAAYAENGVARLRYEGQGWQPPAFCTSNCYDRDHLMTAWLVDSASAVDSAFLAFDLNDSSISAMSQGGTGQSLWTEVPVSEAPWTVPTFEARLRKQAVDLAAAIAGSDLPIGLWGQSFWGHTTSGSSMFSTRKMYACNAAQQVQTEITLADAMWEWASTSTTFPTIVQGEVSASTPNVTWYGQSSCRDSKDAACKGLAIGDACGTVDVMCQPVPADKLLLCSDPDLAVDPAIACLGLESGAPCGAAGHLCAINDSAVWLCPTTATPFLSCNAPGFDPQTQPCVANMDQWCSPSGRCSPPCILNAPALGDATCAAYGSGGDCKLCLGCAAEGTGLCK